VALPWVFSKSSYEYSNRIGNYVEYYKNWNKERDGSFNEKGYETGHWISVLGRWNGDNFASHRSELIGDKAIESSGSI
jgi:hypothetical protein